MKSAWGWSHQPFDFEARYCCLQMCRSAFTASSPPTELLHSVLREVIQSHETYSYETVLIHSHRRALATSPPSWGPPLEVSTIFRAPHCCPSSLHGNPLGSTLSLSQAIVPSPWPCFLPLNVALICVWVLLLRQANPAPETLPPTPGGLSRSSAESLDSGFWILDPGARSPEPTNFHLSVSLSPGVSL